MQNKRAFLLIFAISMGLYGSLPERFGPAEKVFTTIFNGGGKVWAGSESVSGVGSTLEATAAIRAEIPSLLSTLNVSTMLDASCGDCWWISQINLPIQYYIGVDIVRDLIATNIQRFKTRPWIFIHGDIRQGPLAHADLILCRDACVHLSYADISRALTEFKRSGATYVLMTHFPRTVRNSDCITGQWRPLNFQLPPFNFPSPLTMINEQCNDPQYADKSLALWRLDNMLMHDALS